jgi:tetratricopeptide (TPR) repeat protein
MMEIELLEVLLAKKKSVFFRFFSCLIFVFMAACSSGKSVETVKPELLLRAERAVLLNAEKEAEKLYSRFIISFPHSIYIGDAYYQLGQISLKDQSYTRARRELNEALRRARRQEVEFLAAWALSRAWLEDGNLEESYRHAQALKIYERILEKHENIAEMDELLFRAGESAMILSQSGRAQKYFKQLVMKYPRSKWTREVQSRGLTKIMVIAVQLGAFRTRVHAEKLMKKLRHDHFKPYLLHEELYFVRVGHYKTYESAMKMLKSLKKSGYPGFLVP